MKMTFGALQLRDVDFHKPETLTTTVRKHSSLNGETVEKKVVHKPFQLKLSVVPEDRSDFKFQSILGLRKEDKPETPVEIAVTTTDDGKLKVDSKYRYTEKYTDYETRSYPTRYIQAGEEVAPYCYARESKWEYETERIPVTRERTATASNSAIINDQKGFDDLYHLLANLAEKNPQLDQPLAHIEKAGKSFVRGAKKALKESLEAQKKALQEQLAKLNRQLTSKGGDEPEAGE